MLNNKAKDELYKIRKNVGHETNRDYLIYKTSDVKIWIFELFEKLKRYILLEEIFGMVPLH